jgi:hypothetical protein
MSKKNKSSKKSPTKGASAKAGGKAKATKPVTPAKADAKPRKVSLRDAAAVVLKANVEPMRCKDIVAVVVGKGMWTTDAPTPEATLYSAILREMKKGSASRFKKSDRGHFALNA